MDAASRKLAAEPQAPCPVKRLVAVAPAGPEWEAEQRHLDPPGAWRDLRGRQLHARQDVEMCARPHAALILSKADLEWQSAAEST
eukprot:50811-Pleurochrysis_carterae.AAC.2